MFDHVIKTEVVRANLRAMTLVLEAMEHHMLPERRRGKQQQVSSWVRSRMCKYSTPVRRGRGSLWEVGAGGCEGGVASTTASWYWSRRD